MNDLPKITEEQLMQNDTRWEDTIERARKNGYSGAILDILNLEFIQDKLTKEEQLEILNLYKK